MKLSIELLNKKTKERIPKEFEFDVETSFSPQNTWLIRDFGHDETKGKSVQTFEYKKVISIHYGIATIGSKKVTCKVATIAAGFLTLMEDIVISLDYLKNHDIIQEYSFDNRSSTFLIDLDEIKTVKDFDNLSIQEVFAKIVRDYKDSDLFKHLFYKYIINGDINNMINDDQYMDMID